MIRSGLILLMVGLFVETMRMACISPFLGAETYILGLICCAASFSSFAAAYAWSISPAWRKSLRSLRPQFCFDEEKLVPSHSYIRR